MLTLEVGPGTELDGIARPCEIWADCGTVETLDGEAQNQPTYVHDLRQPIPLELYGRFDYVLASHVLEHIDRNHLGIAVDNLVQACKPGGEICILVPSLEWAAARIMEGDNGLAVQGMLWGGQREGNNWDVHYVGFTLAALVAMAKLKGLEVKMAGQTPFEITGGGKRWSVMSNYLLAKRLEVQR